MFLHRAIRALRGVLGFGTSPPKRASDADPHHDDSPSATSPDTSASPASESMKSSEILEHFTLGRQLQDEVLCLCYVEFVGGPLDGHMEGVPLPIEDLGTTIAIPVSPLRLAGLIGSGGGPENTPRTPTSVAFYELDTRQPIPPRYLFLGAARPEDARAMWMK